MKTRIKDYEFIRFTTDQEGNRKLTAPKNAEWLYKCRVSDEKMVPIGVITEEKVAIPIYNDLYLKDGELVKKILFVLSKVLHQYV